MGWRKSSNCKNGEEKKTEEVLSKNDQLKWLRQGKKQSLQRVSGTNTMGGGSLAKCAQTKSEALAGKVGGTKKVVNGGDGILQNKKKKGGGMCQAKS